MKQQANLLLLFFLFQSYSSFAQLDSLYTQQWNRDPITKLNSTTSAQRQIITAEQIRVSGYTNLSDVLQLVDGWTFTGYYNDVRVMQSNGTGSYEYQNWVLMLNGQRMEVDRGYGVDVNQLQVPVNNIERIEVINTNSMYLGEFTQNGLINIITKKTNNNGVSANAFLTSVKDQRTDINTTLGYTQNRFHLNVSLLKNLNSTFAYIPSSYGTRAEMQYVGKKLSHQIQVIQAEEGYLSSGYIGQWNINTHHQIRLSSFFSNYNYTFFTGEASQLTNTLQHRYVKNHSTGNFIWQNGIGVDHNLINNRFTTSSNNRSLIVKPYSSINIPITRKINLFADAQAAFCRDKIAPRISVGMYKRVSLISNYSFVVGYTETLLEEAFNTNIGNDVNAINGAAYFYNPKLATADFYYNLNIGSSVKFSFNSGLKNTYDLPARIYYPYTLINTLGPYTMYDHYTKRSTYNLNWVNRFNVHYDIVKNLVVDINYMNTRLLNTWNDSLQTIPKHKFTVVFQYDLPKRFTIWSRTYVQSKTSDWNRGWFPESPSINYNTLSRLYFQDIGLSKKLWKDYLNLNITVRDIFTAYNNTNIKLHGSFSITANIDGLFAKPKANP